MLIGYARVSTIDQKPELQTDALIQAGVDERNIYEDKISGIKIERPKLNEALEYLKSGDTLIVWKLDRLGRSLSHLIKILEELKSKNVAFRSLTEGIDTSTPIGMLLFHISGAFAQFDREIIRERTSAGLKAAQMRGIRGGRPKALSEEQVESAKNLRKLGFGVSYIARSLNTSTATIYRELSGYA